MFIFSPEQRKHQVHNHWKVSCECLFGLLLHSPQYSMWPSLCESFSSRWNFRHFHNHIEWTDFQTLSGKKNQKSLYYSTFTARLWNDWQLFESVVFSFVATSQNWERGIEILPSLGLKKFDCTETVNYYKTAYKSQLVVKYSNNFLSVVCSPSCEEFAELKMKETDVI